MILVDVKIKEHIERGSVVIDPFNEEQLNNCSYDVTVGENFWAFPSNASSFDQRGYVPIKAFRSYSNRKPGVWVRPGQRILGHTREVIGGQVSDDGDVAVTTSLRGTSTAARRGWTCCQCAGFGDVGYVNRWTLEVMNHAPFDQFLPVGAVIAQVCFFEVDVPDQVYGVDQGQYMHDDWKPEDMLPGHLKVKP